MKTIFKNLLFRILLVLLTVVVTVVVIEAFLRIVRKSSTFNAATELPWMRENAAYFTIDPEMGFRPILGTDLYTEYGTVPNRYPIQKSPGKTRLLFMGDSATYRGRIISELKKIYKEDTFEYWNAGVESFNTLQEVKFYQKYNTHIHPDHIILTFHLNDFEPTPVSFINEQKQLVVYIPHTPLKKMNRWLFEKSYLYRLFVGRTLSPTQGRADIEKEVQQQLQVLNNDALGKNIRLTVLVLPLFKPYAEWSPDEKSARTKILSILPELHVRYFDLYEPYEKAITAGIRIQENQGDAWHPSQEMAKMFAEYLAHHGILEASPNL